LDSCTFYSTVIRYPCEHIGIPEVSSWAARSLLITGGCQPCCFRRQPYSRRAPRGWFVRFLAEKQGITWYESKKTPRILGFRPQTPGKEYGGRRKQQGHKRTWLLQEQREGGRGVSAEASVSLREILENPGEILEKFWGKRESLCPRVQSASELNPARTPTYDQDTPAPLNNAVSF
jgi:hypothetical protein